LKREIEKKLKESKKPDKLHNASKDPLDIRVGATDPLTLWLLKVIMKDFAIKAAIAGAVGASIWAKSADNSAALIARYGKAILMALGERLVKIVQKLCRMDPESRQNIREILLDKNLGNEEKWELLKLKINYALKNLKGKRHTQFIFEVIAAYSCHTILC